MQTKTKRLYKVNSLQHIIQKVEYSVPQMEKVNQPNPAAECKCILENDIGLMKIMSNFIQSNKVRKRFLACVWTQSG